MADDILLTPEEQDERAKQWLKDNALSLIVGVAVGLGAIYGINHHRTQTQLKAEQASELFHEIVVATENSDRADISTKVDTLKAEHANSSYASKAVLMKVKQLVNTDRDVAATELDWVLNHAPESGLKHTARLRLIKLLLTQNNLERAASLVVHQPTEGFESHYHEAIADVAMRQNELGKAKQHYQKAMDALASSDAAYKTILILKLNQIPDKGE